MSSELLADLSDFLKTYFSILIKLAGRRIERDRNLLARLVTGLLNGLQHDFNGLDVRLHRRSKAAFIANRRVVAALLQHALQRVENFHAPAQRLGKRRRSHRHHHEFLEVDVVIGVRAAVEDVHHRHRQGVRRGPAQVAIERQFARVAEARAAAIETARIAFAPRRPLLGVPSRSISRASSIALVGGVGPAEGFRNLAIDVRNRLQNALAEVVGLVAVTQFDGLVLAGGRATRHNGARAGAAIQKTSASTVGLPRESSTWRPRISAMLVRGISASFIRQLDLKTSSLMSQAGRGVPLTTHSTTKWNYIGHGRAGMCVAWAHILPIRLPPNPIRYCS
jgi:hypothetical protein